MILTKQLFLSIAILLASHLSLSAQSDAWRPSEHYTNLVTQFENRNDIDTSTIVMLGNSLTEFGGDWSEKLGRPGIVNYGIMGDNTQGMLRRLYQITPHHPKAIFLMVGTNDVTGEETDEEIFEKCRSVIDAIRTQTPQTRLLVQSLLPVNLEVKLWKILEGQEAKIVDINHRLQDYCERQQLTFINLHPLFTTEDGLTMRADLTTDGLHINEAGYRIWACVLQPYLEEILEQTKPLAKPQQNL